MINDVYSQMQTEMQMQMQMQIIKLVNAELLESIDFDFSNEVEEIIDREDGTTEIIHIDKKTNFKILTIISPTKQDCIKKMHDYNHVFDGEKSEKTWNGSYYNHCVLTSKEEITAILQAINNEQCKEFIIQNCIVSEKDSILYLLSRENPFQIIEVNINNKNINYKKLIKSLKFQWNLGESMLITTLPCIAAMPLTGGMSIFMPVIFEMIIQTSNIKKFRKIKKVKERSLVP
jgi:23S rRNA maturation-related 3'-5' exoribonuclease YhaM